MTWRSASASSRSPSAVDPLTSEKTTVTVLRLSDMLPSVRPVGAGANVPVASSSPAPTQGPVRSRARLLCGPCPREWGVDVDDEQIAKTLDHAKRAFPVPEVAGPEDVDEILVEAWNEKPGRTQREVLALLDSAIARRRRQLRKRRKRAR